ncbi:MAG: hypothetical protein H7101_07380 [Deinococcales bacterium]|nr:hypothetical protein [Chitinophagaceae bacterium]
MPDIKLTNEQRRNLYFVTKNALNNTMKHALANTIVLSCVIYKQQMEFLVSDGDIFLEIKYRKHLVTG